MFQDNVLTGVGTTWGGEIGYVQCMTMESLKAEIVALPDEERHSLAVWLNGLNDDDWDREMMRDLALGGQGSGLLERVRADISAGKFRPIEEFCERRKPQDNRPSLTGVGTSHAAIPNMPTTTASPKNSTS